MYVKLGCMLILYTKDNCKYCGKVKFAFLEKGISYEERNIADQEFLNEAKSYGALTMPLLVDTQAKVSIKQSDEIVDYISEYAF